MIETWQRWGGVLVATALGLPVATLAAWLIARAFPRRPARYAVAEVFMVAGTLPWIWMILTPSAGQPRHVNLVPLHDLIHLARADLVVQIGGNLLVFAALGFLLPIRFALRVPTVLIVAGAGSLAVETLQYLLDLGRVSSVDDVLINTIGAGLAACCSHRWWRGRRSGADAGKGASRPDEATKRDDHAAADRGSRSAPA